MPEPSPSPGALEQTADVLVFGDSDNGFERDNLAVTLRELGSVVDVAGTLPADISEYREIWNAEAYGDLDPREEESLVDFVEGGGGLYLTGERPCCEPLNDSVERVVNRLVTGSYITVGDQGDIDGPFTFNPDAAGSATRVPNVLVDFVPSSPGGLQGIGGIRDTNVLASNETVAVGGVWDNGDMVDGEGRLAVLMDVDWLGKDTRTPIIENIHHFLSFGASCAPKDEARGIVWGSSVPENCTTINTPRSVNFDASVMRGSVDVEISATGMELSCTHYSGSPITTASQMCDFSSAPEGGATITVTAVTSDFGTSTLFYRVKAKNDPRNVPDGYSATSNWWEWPDADNDGIPDEWERAGVWGKNGFLDLPALGADPTRADLFVYSDYQEGFEPSDRTLDYIREGFDESPLNGDQGVEIHFVRGQPIPASIIDDFLLSGRVLNQPGLDENAQKNFQRIATYSGFLASPYATGDGVPQLFKWWLNYDRTVPDYEDAVLMGEAIINGNLLWTSAESRYRQISNPGVNETAQDWVRANNFTHELGHNLGLGHGGSSLQHPTDKKKYKSVMSYAYNTFGVRTGGVLSPGRLDYSRQNAVNLDWRFRAPGGSRYGALTFVQGQNGEYSDFYDVSFSTAFDFSGEVSEPHNSQEVSREVAPADYAAYAAQFGFEPALTFPAVAPVETWNPRQEPVLELEADNLRDTAGSVLIDAPPAHGTLVADGLLLTYAPEDGYVGTDSVTVRVTTGALSSEQLTIAIVVDRATTESPEPTESPTPTVTPSPTVAPTAEPTESPTPTVTPSPTVAPTADPAQVPPRLTLSADAVVVGGEVVVGGTGFAPRAEAEVWLHSTPVLLTSTRTAVDGSLRATSTIPASATPGIHTIVVKAGSGTASIQIIILAAPGTSLPATGGEPAWGLAAGGAVLLAAGAALLIVWHRRRLQGE
ncbi:LPXTG cell wall anchor domain-containing protein [Microbacterium flavum]|uniref:LPXTG cell wall anchor domain-containing protein n=1 Tax=Microbacterium flavum TaxID=415216 RepID=UPI0024AE4A80|nr:Ig-like domain-containing protein [Microbacterium flavum]